MKIDELIEKLRELREAHGNVVVITCDPYGYIAPVKTVFSDQCPGYIGEPKGSLCVVVDT